MVRWPLFSSHWSHWVCTQVGAGKPRRPWSPSDESYHRVTRYARTRSLRWPPMTCHLRLSSRMPTRTCAIPDHRPRRPSKWTLAPRSPWGRRTGSHRISAHTGISRTRSLPRQTTRPRRIARSSGRSRPRTTRCRRPRHRRARRQRTRSFIPWSSAHRHRHHKPSPRPSSRCPGSRGIRPRCLSRPSRSF